MSGTFPSQPFEIPLGSSVSGPSIDVWVFNNDVSESVDINMITEAVPDDVTVRLQPGYTFTLAPSSSLQLFVTVEVGELAPPGFYEDGLTVTAQAVRTEGGEVKILGSVAVKANLTVVSESGTVTASAVGAAGEPVLAEVRLFKVIGDKNYEYAYSASGTLTAVVSPGNYVLYVYKNGEQLAKSETFAVNAGDTITMSLPVTTVSIQGFAVIPQYDPETNDLTTAQISYTIVNVDRALANAELKLVVTRNGVALDTITVLTVDPLNVGRLGEQSDYAPALGWKDGTYAFKLELYIGGVLYAETLEQTLKVGGGGGVASWLWILFVILGILAAAGLGVLIFFLLKRRREEEKPRKAEKKRKEEKPAPKAKEPVRKPEPYRPPEPVRPVQPARPLPKEEPVVEPAPLASISSLKARMASMGRDQGTGQPDEEGPEVGEQETPEETSPQDGVVDVVPPPPRAEPEWPVVPKVQKPPVTEKPVGQKPGIFSSVKATPKQEPPKPPSDIQINWPPKSVEPPKPPSDVQINWPPKSVEPPKPPSDVQVNWPPKPAEPPEPKVEAVPLAPASPEETAGEEPGESQVPPSRSSFAEAARLRMEARQRATGAASTDGAPEESPTEVDGAGEPGEGEERPPTP